MSTAWSTELAGNEGEELGVTVDVRFPQEGSAAV